MTYNLFFLLTGDPGRKTLHPDLLGEMVKIEWGSNLLDQIFNLIARYVLKVHSDEHIRKVLRYNAGRSFLNIIGPSDIVSVVEVLVLPSNKGCSDKLMRYTNKREKGRSVLLPKPTSDLVRSLHVGIRGTCAK